jgi:hypothetical protein
VTQPLWIVWHPDGGEDGPGDGCHFRADSPEDAAVQWAHHYDEDSADYTLISKEGSTETVKVCMVANDPIVHTFKVRGEMSLDYYADEAQP